MSQSNNNILHTFKYFISSLTFLVLYLSPSIAAISISSSSVSSPVGYGVAIGLDSIVVQEGNSYDFKKGYNTIRIKAPNGFQLTAINLPVKGGDIDDYDALPDLSTTIFTSLDIKFLVDTGTIAINDRITLSNIVLTPIAPYDSATYDYRGNLIVEYHDDPNPVVGATPDTSYTSPEYYMVQPEISFAYSDISACTGNEFPFQIYVEDFIDGSNFFTSDDAIKVYYKDKDGGATDTLKTFSNAGLTSSGSGLQNLPKYTQIGSVMADYDLVEVSIDFEDGWTMVDTLTIGTSSTDSVYVGISPSITLYYDTVAVTSYQYSLYLNDYVYEFRDGYFDCYIYPYLDKDLVFEFDDPDYISVFSYGDCYDWYVFRPQSASSGYHTGTITHRDELSGCASYDTIVIQVIPEILTAEEDYCYGQDTLNTISIAKNGIFSAYEYTDGFDYAYLEFYSFEVEYQGEIIDGFESNDTTFRYDGSFYEYDINPTDYLDSIFSGETKKSIEVRLNIYAKVRTGTSGSYYYSIINMANEVVSIHIPEEDGEILDYSSTYCQGADSLRLRSNNEIEELSIYFVDTLVTSTSDTTIIVDTVFVTDIIEYIDTIPLVDVIFVADTAFYHGDTVVFTDAIAIGLDSFAIRYDLEEEVLDHYEYETITTVVVDTVIYSTADASSYLSYSNDEYYLMLDQFTGDTNTTIQLSLEYSDANTCSGSIDYYPVIHKLPEVDFISDTVCEETVQFSQITSAIDSQYVTVNGWEWYFDDGFDLSNFSDTSIFDIPDDIHGGRTDSTYKNPSHYFDVYGKHVVTLGVMSAVGCVDYVTDTIVVGKYPDPAFSFTGSLQLDTTVFLSETKEFDDDKIATISYSISTPSDFDSTYYLYYVDSLPYSTEDSLLYSPEEYGVYEVHFEAITNNQCMRSVDALMPIYQYQYMDEDSSFFDGFTSKELQNGWLHPTDYDTAFLSGWTFEEISGEFDDTDKHTSGYMWRTGLDSIDNEASYLESPCFDIKDLSFPMLSLDIFQSLESGYDGAAVFYTIDDGDNWTRLGDKNSGGANWYEASGINKSPGSTFADNGGAHGWSKDTTAWVVSRYALDNVQEELDTNDVHSCVRFRIAYNSNDVHDWLNQGFAVDNFAVAKRKRVVLIEEFINSDYEASDSEDVWETDTDALNTFVDAHKQEVCDIRYHIETSPYTDDLNYLNIADNSARASSYGASAWGPMWVMDGVIQTKEFYKKVIKIDYASALDERSLIDPSWGISIEDISQEGDSLKITTSIVKLDEHVDETLGAHDVKIRYAIVQKEFTDEGGDVHRNVMLELLPNGIGNVVQTIAAEEQVVNEPVEVTDYWLPTVSTEGQEFRLIVYVQARFNYNEIEQVVFVDIEDFVPGFNFVQEVEYTATGFKVYPNPVSDQLNIQNTSEFNSSSVSWNIYSVNGQVVKQGEINFLNNSSSIDVGALREGIYLLQLIQANGDNESVRFSKITY